MRLTRTRLRQIISEEVTRLLEQVTTEDVTYFTTKRTSDPLYGYYATSGGDDFHWDENADMWTQVTGSRWIPPPGRRRKITVDELLYVRPRIRELDVYDEPLSELSTRGNPLTDVIAEQTAQGSGTHRRPGRRGGGEISEDDIEYSSWRPKFEDMETRHMIDPMMDAVSPRMSTKDGKLWAALDTLDSRVVGYAGACEHDSGDLFSTVFFHEWDDWQPVFWSVYKDLGGDDRREYVEMLYKWKAAGCLDTDFMIGSPGDRV